MSAVFGANTTIDALLGSPLTPGQMTFLNYSAALFIGQFSGFSPTQMAQLSDLTNTIHQSDAIGGGSFGTNEFVGKYITSEPVAATSGSPSGLSNRVDSFIQDARHGGSLETPADVLRLVSQTLGGTVQEQAASDLFLLNGVSTVIGFNGGLDSHGGSNNAAGSEALANLSGLLTSANALNQAQQASLQLQTNDLTQVYALVNNITGLVKSLIP
jgi:hypothetical protein